MRGRKKTNNKKRNIIIGILTITLILSAGGAFFAYKRYKDPQPFIDKGNAYVEKGRHRAATYQYRRAFKKDETRTDILHMWISALEQTSPEDRLQALEDFNMMRALYEKCVIMQPNNEQAVQNLMGFYHHLASQYGDVGSYEPMLQWATTTLDNNPNMVVARKYRGIAQTNRMLRAPIQDEERELALEDLEAALADDPKDIDVLLNLTQWYLYEANRLNRPGQDFSGVEPAWRKARGYVTEMLDAHPDDPMVQTYFCQIVFQIDISKVRREIENSTEVNERQRADALDEMKKITVLGIIDLVEEFEKEERVTLISLELKDQIASDTEKLKVLFESLSTKFESNPEPPLAVVLFSNLLRSSDVEDVEYKGRQLPGGYVKALDLLETAMIKRPNVFLYTSRYGSMLLQAGDSDRAREVFKNGFEREYELGTIDGVIAHRYLNDFRASYAYLALDLSAAAQSDDERKKWLREAEETIDYLQKNKTGTDAQARSGYDQLLSGRMKLMNGDVIDAAELLSDATQRLENGDRFFYNRSLLHAAEAQAKLKNTGEAARFYQRALELTPENVALQQRLVLLFMHANELDRASAYLENWLENDEDNLVAKQLQIEIRSRNGEVDEAFADLDELLKEAKADGEEKDIAAISLFKARLLYGNDRKDEANKFIDTLHEADPKNLQIIQLALDNSRDDRERQDLYLTRAKAAGADEGRIDTIVEMRDASPEEQLAEFLKQIDASSAKPMDKAMTRYTVFRRFGKVDEAAVELKTAAGIDKDDPRVIEAQFAAATADRDWEAAKEIISRARSTNADKANGLFFRADMEYKQGDYRRSIASYSQALDDRDSFADGWRRLGDAHRANGDPNAAIEAYDECLDRDPTNRLAIIAKANALLTLGQNEEGLAQLKRARDFSKNDVRLQMEYLLAEQEYGDKEYALTQREELAEKSPKLYDNRERMVLLLADLDRFDDARAELAKIEEERGKDMGSVYLAGQLLLAEDKAGEGAALIGSYIKSLGDEKTIMNEMALARYLWSAGLIDQARTQYVKARGMEKPGERPATVELAFRLASIGDPVSAANLWREMYKEDPDNRGVAVELAKTAADSGNLDEAQQVLDKLSKDSAGDSTLSMVRASILAQRGETDKAISELTRAIERDPTNAPLYNQRAFIRTPMGNEDVEGNIARAITEDLERALELNPSLIVARRQLARFYVRERDVDNAILTYNALLERSPRSNVDRMSFANVLLRNQRWAQLDELINDSIELFDDDPNWIRMAGVSKRSQGEMEEARKFFADAFKKDESVLNLIELVAMEIDERRADEVLGRLKAHPDLTEGNALLLAIRGRALAYTNRDDQAAIAFQRAIQMCLNDSQISAVYAQIQLAWGPTKALALLQQVGSTLDKIWAEMVIAEAEMSLDQMEEAKSRLLRMDRLVKDDDPYRLRLDYQIGVVQQFTGEFEASAARYEKVLAKNPNHFNALNNLSYMLAEDMGRAKQALPFAERVARNAPNNATVLDTLGWVQFKAGRVTDAERTLRRSIALRPTVDSYYHLGMVLSSLAPDRQQYAEEARRMLNNAIKQANQEGRVDIEDMARRALKDLGSAGG